MMRRLIALRLAARGLKATDLRVVLGYDEAVQRAADAESELGQLKAAIAALWDEHRRHENRPDECRSCYTRWPCDVRATLESAFDQPEEVR